MKKIMVFVVFICTTITVNAATFSWTATNIYDPSGNMLTSGTTTYSVVSAQLFAVDTATLGTSALSSSASFSESGVMTGQNFRIADTVAFQMDEWDEQILGVNAFDFYFVLTLQDAAGIEYTYTSSVKENVSAATNTKKGTVSFGDMTAATTTEGAWKTVPEPTSGLLLLCGLAGLALRRKRA